VLSKVRPQGLSGVDVGGAVRVADVGLPVADRLRLAGFGVRPGAIVTVLGRTPGGGRLVGVGAGRLALDRRTAERIGTDEVGGDAPATRGTARTDEG
ncbi:ferrous iron transport protein A, partial [Pseudonocardia sp. RS11V-5]|uniref:FeoA family protein n=1 Tax=Pseudonocardia terrae TaxID=2905831 RepID=UPI001E5616E6